MKKLLQYPVMLLFFGSILLLSIANVVTPPKAESEMENRKLSQRPTFSFSALLDSSKDGFSQRYETYANDQFVGRDGWITLKSWTEALLGKTENNGIIYGTAGQMFEKYRSYDTERLERNVSLLESFAARYPTLHKSAMIVPSAYEILADRRPRGLGNVDQRAAIGTLNDRLSRAGFDPVDVCPILSAHQEEYIYYRTDHHWTTQGAYLAYQAYADSLGLRCVSLENLPFHTIEGFLGTHYSKAKSYSAIPDVITWYDFDVDSVTIDAKPVDGLYDRSMAEKRDKYAMFLYGNNGITRIENSNAPSRSILVIKDSYANAMVPFLTQSFSRVVVVDLRSMPQKLSELIAQESFDETLVLYSFSNLASDANLPRINY